MEKKNHHGFYTRWPDPDVGKQKEEWSGHEEGFEDRNLKVWEIRKEMALSGNDHADASAFYSYYKVDEEKYTVLLIGKDGTGKLRKNDMLMVGDLFDLIDSMPMRQYEMRQQRD